MAQLVLNDGLSVSERKKMLRERFSRAAATYDSHADLQAELAGVMAALLPANRDNGELILELGCGTGNYTRELVRRFPGARVVALDFSEAMVRQARKKVASEAVSFLCADAETFLAGAAEGFDLITTNAVVHWFEDQAGAFEQVRRLLRPAGIFMASLYGPASLGELAAGLAHVYGRDRQVVAENFMDMETLQRLLRMNFRVVAVERRLFARRYHSLHELLHQIRATGTSGRGRPAARPLTRGALSRLAAWFMAEIGEYRATYEVFMVRCEP